MIKKIVDYMITEGTEQTQEGNYCFYFEELSQKFNVYFEWLQENIENIIEQLALREEVACVDFESDNSFSIYFNLDYCGLQAEEN